MDFYWGMELYPRIFGWDVKMFTNCRAGMMFWAVGILCFAHKNAEVNGGTMKIGMAVNVALQLIYISKFFHWEMGYMCSMDIQHDRAGYYICWGCLVWVPSVYTSHSFYLAKHAPDLSLLVAFCIFYQEFYVFGLIMMRIISVQFFEQPMENVSFGDTSQKRLSQSILVVPLVKRRRACY